MPELEEGKRQTKKSRPPTGPRPERDPPHQVLSPRKTKLVQALEQIVEIASVLDGIKLGGPTDRERLKHIYDTALEALAKHYGIGEENNP